MQLEAAGAKSCRLLVFLVQDPWATVLTRLGRWACTCLSSRGPGAELGLVPQQLDLVVGLLHHNVGEETVEIGDQRVKACSSLVALPARPIEPDRIHICRGRAQGPGAGRTSLRS